MATAPDQIGTVLGYPLTVSDLINGLFGAEAAGILKYGQTAGIIAQELAPVAGSLNAVGFGAGAVFSLVENLAEGSAPLILESRDGRDKNE